MANVAQHVVDRPNIPAAAIRTPAEESALQTLKVHEYKRWQVVARWQGYMDYALACAKLVTYNIETVEQKYSIVEGLTVLNDEAWIRGCLRQYQVHEAFEDMAYEVIIGTLMTKWDVQGMK